jgi:acetyl esterase/lipase
MSAIGLFLALWVVIPAPIFALVPLSVGAPEISPWLVLGNAIALLLTLKVSRLGAIASAIALGLSVLPLLQFPSTNQRAAAAFQTVFPQSVQLAPFNLLRAIPSVRQTKGIEFAKPDGVPLTMNIYRPQAPGKNPAIVMIYGGAWRTGDPNANEDFSLYMAAQGYTVLAIDYRHAPQHKFPAQIQDIETAFKFIQQRADEYEVRLDRLVVMGRSAGAHLALLAAFQGVIPVRGTIAYYSPVDLTEGYNNPPVPDPINSREVLLAFLGGTPQDLPELYRQASPYDWVQPALPPTLLIYGGKDHIVRPNYGRALHEKLIASNNKSIFIEIPWADHAFDAIFNGISNQLALYYTEKFLAETLKP